MTDQEITETIATKIMGWSNPRWSDKYEAWDYPPSVRYVWDTPDGIREFDPVGSDNDCMMAWDKFIESVIGILSNDDINSINDRVSEIMLNDVDTDRRRAMCECMCKAIEESI